MFDGKIPSMYLLKSLSIIYGPDVFVYHLREMFSHREACREYALAANVLKLEIQMLKHLSLDFFYPLDFWILLVKK
jgi:hypothetical protein